MSFEAVIGLEVHAQLTTRSKIFCGCTTAFGAPPNTQTCPVCTGLPGVLPVLNQKAVSMIVKTALALHCAVAPYSRFARKNYFYPDLPKGYQISQYELPIGEHGLLGILVDGQVKKIGITRVHLEEDAGKNLHEGIAAASHVDLNRAGVPLMEIVSEPDIRSPEEAAEYMRKLRTLLRYLEVCDGNMEQGSLRCDANVSLRPMGSRELGVKAEIKNMNSFRFVQKALEYEIQRQRQILEDGGTIVQETRLWDANLGVTESMRSKEEAHDYRYFPEPDLVPLVIDAAWQERLRAALPELPDDKRERFVQEHGLPEYDAGFLAASRAMADYFEACVRCHPHPKIVSNWIMGDLSRRLNTEGKEIEDCALSPEQLAGMLQLIQDGTISGKIAKTVFDIMYETGQDAETVVREKGLVQVTNEGAIVALVDQVVADNPQQVGEYRAGKEKLLGFFVGQVMKASQGKANPAKVNEILRRKLKG